MNVLASGQQMFVMFLLIVVGYFCYKKNLITAENNACLSRLVVNVFNPAMIFSSVLANTSTQTDDSVPALFIAATGIFLFLIFTATILTRFSSGTNDQKHLTLLMYVFANVGFIGIPVVKALLGADKLIYVAVFILEYNILIYTYGVWLLKRGSSSATSRGFRLASLKPLCNMGTLACVATLIVFLGNITIPTPLADGLQHLANATTPLSLIVIGVSLGIQGHILSLFTNMRRYVFCLWKLVLIPLAGTWILKRLPFSETLYQTYMLMMAMPVGNLTLMLAKQYGLPEEEGSNTIILSTLLSVLTIPLLVLLYPVL